MTKYSKLKKSSFAVVILSLLIVAVLAFGGTYAYFSAEGVAQNGSVTTGTLVLTKSAEITVNKTDLVPNEYVDVTLDTMALSGSTISAVRFKLNTPTITKANGDAVTLTADQQAYLELTVTTAGTGETGWVAGSDGYYYYNDYVSELNIADVFAVTVGLNKAAENEWQDLKATFTITFQATQAEHHESLNEDPDFVLSEAEALSWPAAE